MPKSTINGSVYTVAADTYTDRSSASSSTAGAESSVFTANTNRTRWIFQANDSITGSPTGPFILSYGTGGTAKPIRVVNPGETITKERMTDLDLGIISLKCPGLASQGFIAGEDTSV